MAMTIRPTAEQQQMFAERARREGVSVSHMMLMDCVAATAKANRRHRLEEVNADVAAKSAELERRLA